MGKTNDASITIKGSANRAKIKTGDIKTSGTNPNDCDTSITIEGDANGLIITGESITE